MASSPNMSTSNAVFPQKKTICQWRKKSYFIQQELSIYTHWL